jgi:hypothetical protein
MKPIIISTKMQAKNPTIPMMTEPMIHPRTAVTSGPLSGVSVSAAGALADWREGAGAYPRYTATSEVMFI